MRLLSKPTLDSEWSVGTGPAPVGLCGIGAMDVGSSLMIRAVRGSRGPGAVILCSILALIGCVRHVDRFVMGHSGKGGRFTDGEQ